MGHPAMQRVKGRLQPLRRRSRLAVGVLPITAALYVESGLDTKPFFLATLIMSEPYQRVVLGGEPGRGSQFFPVILLEKYGAFLSAETFDQTR